MREGWKKIKHLAAVSEASFAWGGAVNVRAAADMKAFGEERGGHAALMPALLPTLLHCCTASAGATLARPSRLAASQPGAGWGVGIRALSGRPAGWSRNERHCPASPASAGIARTGTPRCSVNPTWAGPGVRACGAAAAAASAARLRCTALACPPSAGGLMRVICGFPTPGGCLQCLPGCRSQPIPSAGPPPRRAGLRVHNLDAPDLEFGAGMERNGTNKHQLGGLSYLILIFMLLSDRPLDGGSHTKFKTSSSKNKSFEPSQFSVF